MHKLKQKLKSQTGASITFALLLFLVCAVVGSAVLVAGTAAAGRMSKVAEMDQRYYAVNSAARLLMDQIAGEKNTATIMNIEAVDTSSDTDDTSAASGFYYLDKTGTMTPIEDDTKFNIQQEAAYWLTQNDSGPRDKKTLQLTAASSGVTDLNHLNVDIEETIDADDGLTLLIKSKEDADKNNGQYSLKLKFNLAKSKVVDETEKQRITTYKYTWNVQELQVVGSQRWQDA